MKLLRRIAVTVFAAALCAQAAFAAETGYMDIVPVSEELQIVPYNTEITPISADKYIRISGTVTAINPYHNLDGEAVDIPFYVLIDDENGAPVNFVITEESINVTGGVPEVGDTFTGFYDANMPVIMIYPPQYRAVAYAVNLDIENLFIPEDGKITVAVEGQTIDTPAPYTTGDDGVLMVPLRAIAEALGYEVIWENETGTVRLNNAVSLTVGEDYYTLGKMAPITLGIAPELVNNRTYVPLSFFRDVVKMNNAYFFEGMVEINNAEKME